MPAQTTTNGPQMMPPQRSSGSGGDDEPISEMDEDEIEDENIDVDEVDDDITSKGDVLVSISQKRILTQKQIVFNLNMVCNQKFTLFLLGTANFTIKWNSSYRNGQRRR